MASKRQNERPPVIAVDGPAASGKGTIARALASHFNLPFMDTGLLYRAVALNLWRWGGDPNDEFEALRACDDLGFDPADAELRTEPVSAIASRISAYGSVRRALLQRQQDFARGEHGAVEHRPRDAAVAADDHPPVAAAPLPAQRPRAEAGRERRHDLRRQRLADAAAHPGHAHHQPIVRQPDLHQSARASRRRAARAAVRAKR